MVVSHARLFLVAWVAVLIFMVMVMVMVVMMMMVMVFMTVTLVTMSRALLSSYVHVSSLTCVQNPYLDDIEEETQDGNSEHDASHDLRRIKEPLSRLIDKPQGHKPNGKDGEQGTEDLHSVKAIAKFLRRVPHGDIKSHH